MLALQGLPDSASVVSRHRCESVMVGEVQHGDLRCCNDIIARSVIAATSLHVCRCFICCCKVDDALLHWKEASGRLEHGWREAGAWT